MKYTSTNCKASPVSLSEAVDRCVAADGGMFMPASIPIIPRAFFNNIGEMSLREIAYVVATSFMGDDINPSALKRIVDESFSFEAPLVDVGGGCYILELFHGPTLTFKDFGARFMARVMNYLDGRSSRRRNVLVATTGNTGAAAANGLYKLDGVSVTVLYPKGHLSRAQASQITALGENIHPIEVMGSVEDCKKLVREAIADPALAPYRLTGANSINIVRLIPQVTFALHAYARLMSMEVPEAHKATYSIPTGNLSNVVAATIARRLGLPMGKIIAAVNSNNPLAPLMAGKAPATPARPQRTLAPSIDMSTPSGWPRLACLYNGDLRAMARDIVAAAPVTDEAIAQTISTLRAEHSYLIDPHGAVAYAAAAAEAEAGAPRVVFATGHPAKQLDIMTRITGRTIELPMQLNRFMAVKRHATILPPTMPALKKHLLSIQ